MSKLVTSLAAFGALVGLLLNSGAEVAPQTVPVASTVTVSAPAPVR